MKEADVALLMKRLSEIPEAFLTLQNPEALVYDLMLDKGLKPATLPGRAWEKRPGVLVQLQVWLAAGSDLPLEDTFVEDFLKWITSPYFERLAHLVDPRLFVTDAERREELVRQLLMGLSLLPRGETSQQAKNRLTTLDSVEKKRIMEETRSAALKAQKLREEMARKAAEEAASKYNRE